MSGDNNDNDGDHLRIDKWLWFARFFRTRSLAAKESASGKLRIGGTVIAKAGHRVKVGDVLTFPQGRHIRVVKVLALGHRRGSAPLAQQLYEDLDPPDRENRLPAERLGAPSGRRAPGSGRPTKRERRVLDRFKTED